MPQDVRQLGMGSGSKSLECEADRREQDQEDQQRRDRFLEKAVSRVDRVCNRTNVLMNGSGV